MVLLGSAFAVDTGRAYNTFMPATAQMIARAPELPEPGIRYGVLWPG
jgi:hypothetical protein